MYKKIVVLCSFAFLTLFLLVYFLVGAKSAKADTGDIVKLSSAPYSITGTGEEQLIEMDGFSDFEEAGRPIVPAKVVYVLIKPGEKVRDIQVRETNKETKHINGKLKRGAGILGPVTLKDPPQEATLSFDPSKIYPPQKYDVLDMEGQMGPYNYIKLRFYPVQYLNGDILISDLDVQLVTASRPGEKTGMGAIRNFISEDKAPGTFYNYDEMQRYYKSRNNLTAFVKYFMPARNNKKTPSFTSRFIARLKDVIKGSSRSPVGPGGGPEDIADFVIVTTEQFYNIPEAKNSIDKLKAHKESLGYAVKIVTDKDYSAFPGDDDAERLRSFLKENYVPWEIRYVLIIGSDDMIPMGRIHGWIWEEQPGGKEYETKYAKAYGIEVEDFHQIPTDWYFSDLDGEFTLCQSCGLDFEAEVDDRRDLRYLSSSRYDAPDRPCHMGVRRPGPSVRFNVQ